jgi:hypothetical protein
MKKLGFTTIVVLLAVIGLALYTIDLFYFSDNKIGVGSTKEIDVDNLNAAKIIVKNDSQKYDRQIKIEYDLPKSGFVVIKIFNAAGNEMMSLVNKYEHSGYHFVSVNDLPEGIYSYRILSGDFNRTGNLLIE